jgi:hypothetical protein
VAAQAQPKIALPHCAPAPLQEASMVLKVKAQDPGFKDNPGQHWVVESLPDRSAITGPDGLKDAIVKWEADPKIMSRMWVLDGINPETLFNSGLLVGLNGQVTINHMAMIPPPGPGGGEFTVTVSFCFALPPGPAAVTRIEIDVFSEAYDALQSKRPDAPGKMLDPLMLTGAQLPSGVTAVALITDLDSREDLGALRKAYDGVAVNAWQAASSHGIKLNATADDKTLQAAGAAVSAIYHMAQTNIASQFWAAWAAPRGQLGSTASGVCCTVEVHGVRMAKAARVQVEGHLPQPAPAQAAPATGAAAKTPAKTAKDPGGVVADPVCLKPPDPPHNNKDSAEKKKDNALKLAAHSQEVLSERFAKDLAALGNSVPTFAQIDALRTKLSAAREIYPSVRPAVSCEDPGVIVFDSDNRWTILGITSTIGAGYSPEEKGTGKAQFDGVNLLLRNPDQLDPKETESFSYAGGGQVQKASGNWILTWTKTSKDLAQSTLGPQLDGDFTQNTDQRFGNPHGPALADHERGGEASFAYSFTSAAVDKMGNGRNQSWGLNASVGPRYRHANINPTDGSAPPPLALGTLAGIFADVTPGYHYTPASSRHLGGIDVAAGAHLIRSFSILDANPFTRISADASATLYFGAAQPRDYFVRFRKGASTSTGMTPLFEILRLGGTDSVRGIEQGEYIGRKLAFEQAEAGLSARLIASWFKHKPAGPAPEKTPSASPIDLSTIYIKGFYDRGFSTDSAQASDLLKFLTHAAHGFGAAVEIQSLAAGSKRITLSLGYAWSPESILHTKGVPITSATINF